MLIQLLLLATALAVVAGLIGATLMFRRHQRALLDQRRAQHQQRGAVHIRELALSTQIYTGRNDVALALLPIAMDMLREAIRLNPRDPAFGRALRECVNLCTAMRDGTSPSGPELASALDSEAALNRARMELIEAARLLSRAENVDPAAMREMQDALKQTQRSIELRLNLRQAAQVAALHHANDSADKANAAAAARATTPSR